MYRIAALPLVLVLMAGTARAQDGQTASSSTTQAKQESASQARQDARAASVPTRTNVKIELTITDQRGNGPAERKQVLMIAADGHWGKIRTHASTRPSDPTAGPFVPVTLNVDARPFMTVGGQIQLDLTVAYNPLDESNKTGLVRPTELNQSMTIVLQSGKPLVISQAADPIADRKMIVEVVATVLK